MFQHLQHFRGDAHAISGRSEHNATHCVPQDLLRIKASRTRTGCGDTSRRSRCDCIEEQHSTEAEFFATSATSYGQF